LAAPAASTGLACASSEVEVTVLDMLYVQRPQTSSRMFET
jgi:hypothetical protein